MAPPRTWDETGKFCPDCEEKRPLEEFYVNQKGTRTVVSTRCRPHHTRYYDARRLEKHGSRAAARWYEKWGLTQEGYDALLESQGGVCAICERPARGGLMDHSLHVDHDHETGEVRGLLCRSCNTALHLLDDPAKRERALAYLGL